MILRMIVSDSLRDEGYDIIEAANAEEALTIFDAAIDIDLLVTDVRMPGVMDGMGLAHHSKAIAPWRPVIVCSAHMGEDLADPIDAFLRKPYPSHELIDVVERLIGPACLNRQQTSSAS